jgi:hypothetical protein
MVAKLPKRGGDYSQLVPERDISGAWSGEYQQALFAVDDAYFYYWVGGSEIRREPK